MSNNIDPTITLSLSDLKGICTLAYHGLQVVRGHYIVADETMTETKRTEWQREIKISTQMIAEYNDYDYLSSEATDLIETLGC